MLTTLQTAYTDTRAGDLAWSLGTEPLPALAVVDLDLDLRLPPAPDGTRPDRAQVQMRLLGASHQILLRAGGAECSETVACLPGRRTPLPLGVAERVGDWDYEFAARVETLPPTAFASRAQELLALVADHPDGLAGRFPGDPNAFTALLVHRGPAGDEGGPGQVVWRTWHAYPQEGRLVATRSRVSGLR